MDKQREDFEAWVREHGNHPRRPELRSSDGSYHYIHTEHEWIEWQAAKAAQPQNKAAPDHLPDAGNMVAQPAQADLQAAFAKGMACRPASAQMPAEPGEKAQPMCTPEEAARICSTLGPVPDGKTWAQHMVDTARTGWVPSTMGHAEYLVETWPILGGHERLRSIRIARSIEPYGLPAREGQRGDMGAVATTSNLANKPPGQS